jgi:ubiquinone/menaquinone biosynthesis C-methylase UbiE
MDAPVDLTEAPGAARGTLGAAQPSSTGTESRAPQLPAYLRETYHWAYLNPRNVRLLDRESIVAAILWGNHRRLRRAAFAELQPGRRVLQPACVYGAFSPALARHLGPRGRLKVIDVAPIQVAACRRKLRGFPRATVRRADAASLGGELYDAVCCYFLLHELPEDYKRAVVDTLLTRVVPGGKVVFVDYHKPHWAHPLKGITSLVFDTLEPFAKDLWRHEIRSFAGAAQDTVWSKETYFGGLFQKVVARTAEAPRRWT